MSELDGFLFGDNKEGVSKDSPSLRGEKKAFKAKDPPGPRVPKPQIERNIDTISEFLFEEGVGKESSVEKPLYEKLLEGLDYAGNVTRSFIKGTSDHDLDTGIRRAKQAAKKQRHTPASDVKDIVTEKLGVGKVRIGKDDGEFQWGDVADFGADLITDVFTDPVSLASFGVGSVLKGGKLAGVTTKGMQNASKANALLKASKKSPTVLTKDAIKLQGQLAAGKAGIGAVYGFGAADGNDSLASKLFHAGAGAGAVVAGGKYLPAVGKAALGLGDTATNFYMYSTRGSKYGDFSNSHNLARSTMARFTNTAEWIRQGRLQSIGDLSASEKIRVSRIMQDAKNYHVTKRNDMLKKAKIKPNSQKFYAATNHFNQLINKHLEKNFIPEAVKAESDKVVKAITSMAKHNEDIIKKYNDYTGKNLIGLNYHIPDVYVPKNDKLVAKYLEKLEGVRPGEGAEGIKAKIPKINAAMSGESSQTVEELAEKFVQQGMTKEDALVKSFDQAYGAYADKWSKKYVNQVEQDALKLMSEFNEVKVSTPVAIAENGLKSFDKLTNFMKANMLYMSTSWLKSNYWDNLTKAFVEDGFGAAVDAGTLGLMQKDLSKDIWNIYANKMVKYNDKELAEAITKGAIDGVMFRSLADDETMEMLKSPLQIAKEIKGKSGAQKAVEPVTKAMDKWTDMLSGTIGRVGSYMEGYARMATYNRNKQLLIKSGIQPEVAKDAAAEIVSKTFFDYGDIRYAEGAVLKRMIPFWSFYSKNVPYWIKSVVDPEKAGRLQTVDKARRNIGSDLDEYDKEGLSDFILDNAPRKLGKNKEGQTEFAVFPSLSLHDALKSIPDSGEAILSEFIAKGNPYWKMPIELATGQDMFTGGDFYPSQMEEGTKYLFSRGFKWYAAKQGLKKLGIESDVLDVGVDEKGNPTTTSDLNVVVDKVISTIFPHGAVDQIAGSVGKVMWKKETLNEALGNRLLPANVVKVSPGFMRMMRQTRASDETKP